MGQHELSQHLSSQAENSMNTRDRVPQEFYYQTAWRSRSIKTGSHKTKLRGAGGDFSGFATLLACPDPKRLDVRASLRAIPKQLMVRTFYERSAIKVYAVNDISSSMAFVGKGNKQQLLLEIVESIAWSATRQGDAFGMLCCDDEIHNNLSILPTSRSMVTQEARSKLQHHFLHYPMHSEKSSQALPASAMNMSPQRALVFIISDFHLPDTLIRETYRAYAMHDVVPIVLWDACEFDDLPSWGLARLKEMETGVERSFFMRAALRQSIRLQAQSRRKLLAKFSQEYGYRPPFFVSKQFNATALTQHLLGA